MYYITALSNLCLTTAWDTLPHTCKCSANGWKEYVEPVREKSVFFWHNIWVDCGKPRNGCVADIMRRSRSLYHYTIHHIRKQEHCNDVDMPNYI